MRSPVRSRNAAEKVTTAPQSPDALLRQGVIINVVARQPHHGFYARSRFTAPII